MTRSISFKSAAMALSLSYSVLSTPALAHGHHHHDHKQIHQGVFDNADVQNRTLADWQGSWKSLYPLLQNGTLDEVFEHKAAINKDKTVAEYKAYYKKGYASDITAITITPDSISFTQQGKTSKGIYAYSGFKIAHYPSGRKGVRYLFTRSSGDANAPKFVQFSDHDIEPTQAAHFHIFFGNESHAQLEKELTNWPTFFPAKMNNEQIVADLMLE